MPASTGRATVACASDHRAPREARKRCERHILRACWRDRGPGAGLPPRRRAGVEVRVRSPGAVGVAFEREPRRGLRGSRAEEGATRVPGCRVADAAGTERWQLRLRDGDDVGSTRHHPRFRIRPGTSPRAAPERPRSGKREQAFELGRRSACRRAERRRTRALSARKACRPPSKRTATKANRKEVEKGTRACGE